MRFLSNTGRAGGQVPIITSRRDRHGVRTASSLLFYLIPKIVSVIDAELTVLECDSDTGRTMLLFVYVVIDRFGRAILPSLRPLDRECLRRRCQHSGFPIHPDRPPRSRAKHPGIEVATGIGK